MVWHRVWQRVYTCRVSYGMVGYDRIRVACQQSLVLARASSLGPFPGTALETLYRPAISASACPLKACFVTFVKTTHDGVSSASKVGIVSLTQAFLKQIAHPRVYHDRM